MALANVRKHIALAKTFKEILGATKANVVVHIRRRIIQIECEHAGIGRIIPIAAAFEGAFQLNP